MKEFDPRLQAPVKPVYRVLAMILAIPFLIMGIGGLVEGYLAGYLRWDHNTKFYIAATGCGTIFLIVALRGRLGSERRPPS